MVNKPYGELLKISDKASSLSDVSLTVEVK